MLQLLNRCLATSISEVDALVPLLATWLRSKSIQSCSQAMQCLHRTGTKGYSSHLSSWPGSVSSTPHP